MFSHPGLRTSHDPPQQGCHGVCPAWRALDGRHPACVQASQLVERWQPWWHLPEAGTLHLTPHGTRPVRPLADADTPAEELGTQHEQQPGAGAAGPSPLPEPPSERVGWQLDIRLCYETPAATHLD